MLKKRIIPVLLLKNNGLVKTRQFQDPKYLGDPINAVRIFNDKEVDELVFLDIMASAENRGPQFDLIEQIASECFMPFGYGGGVKNIDEIKQLFKLGVEKVIMNSAAQTNPELIREAADIFGSQSIVVSIDVKKNFFGKHEIYTRKGLKNNKMSLLDFVKKMEQYGAGELLINSVDKDGVMKGYDVELYQNIASQVAIPVVACGGAGNLEDMRVLASKTEVSGLAAGSMFVYHGPHNAVLINYPKYEVLSELFK